MWQDPSESSEQAGRRPLKRLAGCHAARLAGRIWLMELKQANETVAQLSVHPINRVVGAAQVAG